MSRQNKQARKKELEHQYKNQSGPKQTEPKHNKKVSFNKLGRKIPKGQHHD